MVLLLELQERNSSRNQPALQNRNTEERVEVLLLIGHLLLCRAALGVLLQRFLFRHVLLRYFLLRPRFRWNPILIRPLQLHFLYGHRTVLRLLGLGNLRHARPWR